MEKQGRHKKIRQFARILEGLFLMFFFPFPLRDDIIAVGENHVNFLPKSAADNTRRREDGRDMAAGRLQ